MTTKYLRCHHLFFIAFLAAAMLQGEVAFAVEQGGPTRPKFSQPLVKKHGRGVTGPTENKSPYAFASYQSNTLLLYTVKAKTAFQVELDQSAASLVEEKFVQVDQRWYHLSHWSAQTDYFIVVDPMAKKFKKFESAGTISIQVDPSKNLLLINKDTYPDPNRAPAFQKSVPQIESWTFGNW